MGNLLGIEIRIQSIDLQDNPCRLSLSLTIKNIGQNAVRIPKGIATPDPFQVRMQDDLERVVPPGCLHSAFAFCADPNDSMVLPPGEITRLQGDLLDHYSSVDRGNYTVIVSLDMRKYLSNLRSKVPDIPEGQDYPGTQSEPFRLFVPYAVTSPLFAEIDERVRVNRLRRSEGFWQRIIRKLKSGCGQRGGPGQT